LRTEGGRLVVDDVPRLRPPVVACDLSNIAHPDEETLDTLARLQLTARRLGTSIRLYNACALLADLIEIAGLRDVLVVVPSGDDADRQAEQREEVWIDEEVLRGDRAVFDGEDVE
jgi:ABC-type transporter Mla MlaB component